MQNISLLSNICTLVFCWFLYVMHVISFTGTPVSYVWHKYSLFKYKIYVGSLYQVTATNNHKLRNYFIKTNANSIFLSGVINCLLKRARVNLMKNNPSLKWETVPHAMAGIILHRLHHGSQRKFCRYYECNHIFLFVHSYQTFFLSLAPAKAPIQTSKGYLNSCKNTKMFINVWIFVHQQR